MRKYYVFDSCKYTKKYVQHPFFIYIYNVFQKKVVPLRSKSRNIDVPDSIFASFALLDERAFG